MIRGAGAARLWEPLTVAFAESVMVAVKLLIVWIVVPDGMPVPVTVSPTTSPVVLLMPVTEFDPLVSVPMKVVGTSVVVLASYCPALVVLGL